MKRIALVAVLSLVGCRTVEQARAGAAKAIPCPEKTLKHEVVNGADECLIWGCGTEVFCTGRGICTASDVYLAARERLSMEMGCPADKMILETRSSPTAVGISMVGEGATTTPISALEPGTIRESTRTYKIAACGKSYVCAVHVGGATDCKAVAPAEVPPEATAPVR